MMVCTCAAGTELENMRIHLLEELGLSQEVEVTNEGLTTRLENLARVCGLNTFINEEMRDEWIALDMDKDRIPVSDVRLTVQLPQRHPPPPSSQPHQLHMPMPQVTAARGLELLRRAVESFVQRYRNHDVYQEITLEEERRAIMAPEVFRNDDRFGWSRNAVTAAGARREEMRIVERLSRQISKAKARSMARIPLGCLLPSLCRVTAAHVTVYTLQLCCGVVLWC